MSVYQYIDFTKGATIISGMPILTIEGNNIQSYNDGYCTANLIHGYLTDIPSTFCISFYERITLPNAIDWNHIFSFGTHNNYGGDDPYYPLAIRGTRVNINGWCSLSECLGGYDAFDVVKSWHLWQIYVHDNTVSYYMDSSLLKKGVSSNLGYMKKMYLNGAGYANQMISDIRFICISPSPSSTKNIYNLIEDKYKNYYGILATS